MKQKHVDFIMKFHKPTSRHLYTLRYGGVDLVVPVLRSNEVDDI